MITLDLGTRILAADGKKVLLTAIEQRIVIAIYNKKDTPQKIIADVFPHLKAVSVHTLHSHIFRLRRKLDGIDQKWLISTSDRNSYFLKQELTVLSSTHSGAFIPSELLAELRTLIANTDHTSDRLREFIRGL